MTMNKKQREHMRAIGKKGGKTTSKKYGSSHFSKIGRKGQKALLKELKRRANEIDKLIPYENLRKELGLAKKK